MSGGNNIVIKVEFDEFNFVPYCSPAEKGYLISLPPDSVKRELMGPFFGSIVKCHAHSLWSRHGEVLAGATVKIAWVKNIFEVDCDPSDDYEYPGVDIFEDVHTILHAIADANPGPIFAKIMVEDATIDKFWNLIPRLPTSIESIIVGPCDRNVGDIPPNVWASLRYLRSIHVRTSRTEDWKIGPAITFERPKSAHPRDDEPEEPSKRKRTEVIDFATSTDKSFVVHPRDEEPEEPSKRKRTEVIDFETSTAKAFLVLALEDEDDRAETFQIAVKRPVKFRAISFEEIPEGGASSLIDAPFTSYHPVTDLREFISVVYATKGSVERCEVKPNILASVVAGKSVWGRAVFVKK